jgi:hypothetical protein
MQLTSGALVGVESVTPEGLKDVYKEFNSSGMDLVERLRTFRQHGVYARLFIFGLPSDRPETFDATALAASQAEVAFAQFVTFDAVSGTVDFMKWEKTMEASPVTLPVSPSPALAHSPKPAPQIVLVAPHHVGGENSPSHPIRVGYVLQSEVNLGAFAIYKIHASPFGISADLKNLPPDVCRYRNRHRQCPCLPVRPVGPLAREAVSALVCSPSHAQPGSSGGS